VSGWPDRGGWLVVQGLGAFLGVPARWPTALAVGSDGTSVDISNDSARVADAVRLASARYTLRAGDVVASMHPVAVPPNARVPVRATGLGYLRLETLPEHPGYPS
jgi:hypothetical protein